MEVSHDPIDLSEENVKRLKDKYSKEMKDEERNPIKVCMKLVFEAATERDLKKRMELSNQLSILLTQPNGLVNLFLTLIDFDTSSQVVTTHNQRFVAVANIITRLPKVHIPHEDYFKSIRDQLKPLLISENTNYSKLASIIMISMLESPHIIDKNVSTSIIEPLFDGLRKKDAQTSPYETVILINNLIINRLPVKFLVNLFPDIFYAFALLDKTPSILKGPLRNCLLTIVNDLRPGPACCLIEKVMFYDQNISDKYCLEFTDEGVSIKLSDSSQSESRPDDEQLKKLVLSILQSSNNEDLVLEFFFHFKERMWSSTDERFRKLSAELVEPLLMQSINENSTGLDLLNIIATKREKSIHLISRTLSNYISLLRWGQSDKNSAPDQKMAYRSIESCLNITEVLYAASSSERDIKLIKSKCVPIMKIIQDLLVESNSNQEIIDHIKSLLDSFNTSEKLIVSGDADRSHTNTEMSSILKDLNDQLVPVQVHALIRLKQLFLANDSEVMSRVPQLFPIIESSLANEEPYVYMACINLAAEMALRQTDILLPKLIGMYTKHDSPIELRLKMGEVLVRLMKQLNETTPFYAQKVIDAFMHGCEDSSDLIRMSCLTNLGELCNHMGNSLGKYITRILALVEDILRNDNIEVKCAAVDLLRVTLMGLDRIKLESVQRDLKNMYKLLKLVKNRSLDDNLCCQVDLALDEMTRLARELLGIRESDHISEILKNIKVTSIAYARNS